MTDRKRFQAYVTFHGGGTISADSMDEAIEKAKESDWTPNGIASIYVEDLETGNEQEVWR